MFYVVRNHQKFGPYELNHLADLVSRGNVILQDEAIDEDHLMPNGKENECVRDLFLRYGVNVSVRPAGGLIDQIRSLGSRIFISREAFNWQQLKQDKRLIMLAAVGLAPLVLGSVLQGGFLTFYTISLYFACVWGLFFYYLFRTAQVSAKLTLKLFFSVQVLILLVFHTGLNELNFFYQGVDSQSALGRTAGFLLGVGVTEELVKALPLFFIAIRSRRPLIPQTMVFYGLMCGIAFGVSEGVGYQMQVNCKLDYDQAFFLNIARLTSLPFFHAMCTGVAGYFISFGVLYPRHRWPLFFFAIAVPALFHGLYDVMSDSLFSLAFAAVIVILLNYYLRSDRYVQSVLKN